MIFKNTAALVLAAGNSSRINSDVAKIFHDLSGRSVIGHVLNALEPLSLAQTVIIASPNTPKHVDYKDHTVVVQQTPLGTGDAVRVGLEALDASKIAYVLILCGDAPLITESSLKKLMASTSDLSLISARLPAAESSKPYGRLDFDAKGNLKAIIEYKDASFDEKNLDSVNGGVYLVKLAVLQELLPHLTRQNASSEYYLTDIVSLCVASNYRIETVEVDFEEIAGVNTRSDLEYADSIIQKRLKDALRSKGVTFQQAQTTRVCVDTEIGKDTLIEASVIFGKGVRIGKHSRIKSFSYLCDCIIHNHVQVGPFAHIRGGSELHQYSEVGNFVELKATTFHEKVKAKHLSYLGDATVGAASNIGAGTITVNYDGYLKHKTHIGAKAMIGANSTLIAPIKVADGVIVAAGSVISNDAPEDCLAITRSPQIIKEGWASDYHQKKRIEKNVK